MRFIINNSPLIRLCQGQNVFFPPYKYDIELTLGVENKSVDRGVVYVVMTLHEVTMDYRSLYYNSNYYYYYYRDKERSPGASLHQ